MAAVFAVTASAVTSRAVTIVAGAVLAGTGLWRLLSRRHFRWVGMRLSTWELGVWSFLMSSVHGAGLMLVPVLAHHSGLPVPASLGWAAAASLLHAAAMLLTAGVLALLVLEFLGLGVLRRAWVNVDKVWAVALIGAGAPPPHPPKQAAAGPRPRGGSRWKTPRWSNSPLVTPSRNETHSCAVKARIGPVAVLESRTATPPSGSGATSTHPFAPLADAFRQSRPAVDSGSMVFFSL